MNTIIQRISEIEDVASGIRQSAEETKRQHDEEMAQRTKAFDERSAKETAEAIETVRAELSARNEEALQRQREETQAVLDDMDAKFEETHAALAEAIFRRLIGSESRL